MVYENIDDALWMDFTFLPEDHFSINDTEYEQKS